MTTKNWIGISMLMAPLLGFLIWVLRTAWLTLGPGAVIVPLGTFYVLAAVTLMFDGG